MVRITLDMIRKKSEHNTGLLAELEELTLHQLNIEKLEVIHKHCRRLKILYLQNNYIEKIENAYKLKDLRYLNLALNSIQVIEGLRSCEKLEKLDLTVNFVSEKTLYESMENVRHNIHLHEIYFTGNPCTEAEGYRLFVIGSLARLVRLDGTDVTKTERIQAKQQYPALAKKFKSLMEKLTNDDEAYGSDDEDDGDVIEIDDKGNRKYKYTPALRRQMMKEDIEQKRLEAEKKNEPNQFTKPADPLREAQERLAKKVTEWKDGELPSQRNTSRTDYRFKKDPSGKNLLLEVEVPRYMDTSLLDVDIHPLWLQVVAKGSNLLLHLPEEVSPDQCKVQRIMTNGSLLLTLRKVKTSASLQRSEYGSSGGLQSGDRAAVEVSSTLGKTNTVRNKENQQAGNLTGSIKRGTDGGFLKEASARRSDSLEAAYQTRKAREKKEEEERKRREEQDKAEADRMKREERLADARLKGYDGGNMCDAEESDEELDFAALGFDPDEVPPLM